MRPVRARLQIKMQMCFVKPVRTRSQHCHESGAGALLQRLEKCGRRCLAGDFETPTLITRECADIKSVSGCVLAHSGVFDAVPAPALIGPRCFNAGELRGVCKHCRGNVLPQPLRQRAGERTADESRGHNRNPGAIAQHDHPQKNR